MEEEYGRRQVKMLVEQKGYQGRQTMFGNVVKPAVAELLTLGTPTVSPNQQVSLYFILKIAVKNNANDGCPYG